MSEFHRVACDGVLGGITVEDNRDELSLGYLAPRDQPKVNWPALGSVSIEQTEMFIEALQEAVRLARTFEPSPQETASEDKK